ncbi:MAG: tetratricopeptide repeat protein [SAR324 cluster bacterium]|nr:tetratricopeptide repeat protein [SAR324 cluster bacterium]
MGQSLGRLMQRRPHAIPDHSANPIMPPTGPTPNPTARSVICRRKAARHSLPGAGALLYLVLGAALVLPLPLPAQQSLGGMYREGLSYLRREQPELAAQSWERLLKKSPYHFNAQLGLAKLYLDSDPERALPHLASALELRPVSDSAHYHMGRYLEKRQRHEEAAQSYRQAIRLNARHYAANRRLRGVIRFLRKRQSLVERAAEKFWANPSLAALTLFGRIVLRDSEPHQALLEFEQVRERLPELPEVQLWIARAHRGLGSLKGEIAAYEAYLDGNKEAHGVRLLMLERLLGAGEFRKAGAALERLERALQATGAGRRQAGRYQFLRSRFLLAKGDAGQAGEVLLASGKSGHDPAQVEEQFSKNVALYPAQAGLWRAYGDWLRHDRKPGRAATAYLKAATLDAALQPQVLPLLHALAAPGEGGVEANLALGELALARGDEGEAIARLNRVPPGHQADARASLLLGLVYRNRGELTKSLEAFTRYVFSFEQRAGMSYARGNLFWVMGQKDVAAGMWGRNLKELRDYPQALVLMAGYLRESGEAGRELDVRQHLKAAAPENVANRIRLGDLLLEQGQAAAAAQEWEQASRHQTGDFDLLVRLGRAYLAQSQFEQGAAALRRAAQIGTLEPVMAVNLARHLLASRRYDDALDFYWQIYRTDPKHPDLVEAMPRLVINTPALPEQRLVAARFAEISQRPELAIELLEELLRLHPATKQARVWLASLYLQEKAAEEALLIIEGGAAVLGVVDVASLKMLAAVQLKLEQTPQRAETLRRIMQLEPENSEVARQLGFLLSEMHRLKEARPYLRTALTDNARNPKLLFYLARAELALGEAALAESHLKALFAIEPEHWRGRQLLLRLLQRGQRWEELEAQLLPYLAAHPEDAEARYNLVVAYLNLFQYEQARPHYEILRAAQPSKVRTLQRYFK